MLFKWMSNALASTNKNTPIPAQIQDRITIFDSVNIMTKKNRIAKMAMHNQVVIPRCTECAIVWPKDIDRYLE